MKNGNTREFLETIAAQDACVDYHGRHFFVNGCCQEWDRKTKKTIWARMEMYEMADVNCSKWIADVCSITKPTVEEVMAEFTRIPLIDGKTFWELENELEWV